MKVAIQGITGSFHEQAAKSFFAHQAFQTVECTSFRKVFDAVTNGTAEYGLVAVENSLHGPLNQVYRLLASEKLHVCGEYRLKIELCLISHMAVDPVSLNDSRVEVLSHAAALSQCEHWLDLHLPRAKRTEVSDTAEAVRMIKDSPDSHLVAVASRNAAEIFNAHVVAGPINDDPHNYTRFFVITKKDVVPRDAGRTSIIITENQTDTSGTLYDALGVFAKHSINLSKLDSHPLPGQKRRYAFYIDFDKSIKDAEATEAIESLKNMRWNVTILGSYRADKH